MIKRVLYLGWLGHANVGDDVLFEMFKRGLLECSDQDAASCVIDIDGWQSHKGYEQSVDHYDMVVLGGGSIFHIGYWLSICLEAHKRGATIVAWGTGVDALSKSTISLLPPATRAMVADVLAKMDYIACRGPYTKAWLLDHDASVDIDEIGDPALNYRPPIGGGRLPRSSQHSPQRTSQHSPQRTHTIYVNWGSSANQIFGHNEEALEHALCVALQQLCQQGFQVVIVPVWTEDREHCKRLAERVSSKQVQLIPNVLAADRLFGVLQQCKIAISFKLHGAILAAAAGCLPVSLAYRFKCIEFMQSVGLSDYCLPTDDVDSNAIVAAVNNLNHHWDAVSHVVADRSSGYQPMLQHSYRKIFSLLIY